MVGIDELFTSAFRKPATSRRRSSIEQDHLGVKRPLLHALVFAHDLMQEA